MVYGSRWPRASECQGRGTGFDGRDPCAFRVRYPRGLNFVTSHIETSHVREHRGLDGRFVGLAELIRRVLPPV